MTTINQKVYKSMLAMIKNEQRKISDDMQRRKRKINELVEEQTVQKRQLVELTQLIRLTDGKYTDPIYPRDVPANLVGATHWAKLPDGSILFYKVTNEVLLWFSCSKRWDNPTFVPYALNLFDDEGS